MISPRSSRSVKIKEIVVIILFSFIGIFTQQDVSKRHPVLPDSSKSLPAPTKSRLSIAQTEIDFAQVPRKTNEKEKFTMKITKDVLYAFILNHKSFANSLPGVGGQLKPTSNGHFLEPKTSHLEIS